MPYDGELLLLNFKTNKEYIEKELEENEFWNKNDKIGQKQDVYFVPKVAKDFKEEDYTYYAIQGSYSDERMKEYFPGLTGIGVDMKNNKILYFYQYPAD